MGNWNSRLDELDIALINRSSLHTWTRNVSEMARDLGDAVESGARELQKRLRKTPVLGHDGIGLMGPAGRVFAMRRVTSGYLRAAQEIQAVPLLVSKAFYTFDGLYVPGQTMKELGGGLDATS